MRRLRGGVRLPVPAARRSGDVRPARGRQAPELLPGAVESERCRPRRGPDVHLLGERGRRGADEQLARPRGDARDAHRAVPGLHARPHDVRRAVLDGPAWLADRSRGRAAHRLGLRGRVDADHDPHGPGRPRGARQRRGLRAVPALGGHAAGRRRGRRPVAVQRREVHRALPGDARDLVVRVGLRRQRAARQEVLRAPDRVSDGARRGLARRAHADPQAHLARGEGQARHRGVPVGVREDEPRDADPDAPRDGRSRRSATTSRG